MNILIVDGNEKEASNQYLDLGMETINQVSNAIAMSKTLLWNGPLGVFETKPFDTGTILAAKSVAKLTNKGSLISVAGGGDTLAAIKNAGLEKIFTHLSTAGGAFLESLEGKELPGIKVLRKN